MENTRKRREGLQGQPPSRPTTKQIEDAAAQVQRHLLQAVDHATAGNYRRAHAEAEAAQGAARKL